ncbi:MAG: nicotinate phosphoribosyltransferase [Thermomicrobiales bacterium]
MEDPVPDNLALMTDSYKASHARLYPPGMTHVFSYLEARGGIFPETIFFGLQAYLLEYLTGPVISGEDIDEAEAFWTAHFGRHDVFSPAAWRALLEQHGGRLPVRIRAVPEGTSVPVDNVLMTIENTDPAFAWLPGWLETLLLKIWYPTTIATQSATIRRDIAAAYAASGEDPAACGFACHDFGYRGVSSEQTAGLGGAAHLLSFDGTDTVAGIRLLARAYDGGMSGFSIPATEHSVIVAWGRDHEEAAYKHLLETFPGGVIACVSDSYDIFAAVERIWGEGLGAEVLARAGTLVIRPDSGDPAEIVPWVLDTHWQRFGGTVNAAGLKVLDPRVRVIQGDGMALNSIGPLYQTIIARGYSAVNLTVGSGGGLLQKVNRDTCQFALKTSEVTVAGRTYGVAKTPVTDANKRSKEGRLKLVRTPDGGWETLSSIDHPDRFETAHDELVTVFESGDLVQRWSLADIRERVRSAAPTAGR